MGYWLADGSLGHNYEIGIAQQDDNRRNIFNCISRMGYKARYNGGKVEFNNKDFFLYLKQFGHCTDKFIPDEIKQASAGQIKTFLDAFISCDGYKRKGHSFIGNGGTVFAPKYEERLYYTTSKHLADGLGELILKTGKHPSYSIRRLAGTKKQFRNGEYTINNDLTIISECRSQCATQYNKQTVEYDGYVYDLTLAANNTMFLRRNGKTFWGSNCRCIAVSILKEEDEIIADAEAIMDGEQPSAESVNTVTDVPDGFKQWITTNESRIAAAEKRGTLPYFIRDNYKDGKYANGFAFATIDKDRAAYGSLIENLTLSDYSREDIPKRGIVNSPSIYYENPDKVTKNDLQFLLENYFESSDINGRFSSVTIKAGASKEFMTAVRDVKAGKRANDHNYLELTNHNFMITKDKKIMFNPSEELLNALQQIRNGKTLTFKEEYAVENLWHEIMHMKSKGWVDYKLKKEPAITAMEVVNQMTARSTYNEFLHSLGGKAVHQDLIVTSGFGYHHEINRFTKLLTDNKIDADVFVNDFKNLIYTEKYEDIYKKMIEYLEKNGIKNAKEALTHVF